MYLLCSLIGELTVFCDGPHNKAFCELRDNNNGTFTVSLNAQETGYHDLHVQYAGIEVLGKFIKSRHDHFIYLICDLTVLIMIIPHQKNVHETRIE